MTEKRRSDRLLADALLEAVIVLQPDNSVDWCNQVARALFHVESATVHGSSISDLIPDSALEVLLEKKEEGPIEIVSPVDLNSRLSICVRPYDCESKLLLIKNITHTVHLEAMRQDFVANVSHELRTPLTVFHGYLDLLIGTPDVSIDKLLEILHQMAGQAERMERLVEDLLLLSKLESVEPDVSKHAPINIHVLLKEIIEDARLLSHEQHQFVLEADEDLILNANIDEIHSAFSNLIFNAVRYTPVEGVIEVSWVKQNDVFVLTVKDNGIGIAAKHIARITQRFYRVDKSRLYRGQGGTGLGLAIVKHVALRHNAELVIDSKPSSGSVFQLIFSSV